MGKALYRKYRSRSLDDIVGQEHITTTLKNALKNNKISHAYLLTGPRVVGKTSVARIMAHEVNGLPYAETGEHLDIIEIDAASNRRIDEIRDLRDKVHTAPTSAKYKVYIIDEVHMLTKEAFNALLKTLEEPPEHVIFILATTESHKLPATIISRTQRFNFKPADPETVFKHLKNMAKEENIKITDDAIQLIANHGEGSYRDSISLLDQASNFADKITLDLVQQLLGIPPNPQLNKILGSMESQNAAEVVNLLAGLQEQGFQAAMTAKQLSSLLREQLINKNTILPTKVTLELLQNLLMISVSSDPQKKLELTLMDALFSLNNYGWQPQKLTFKASRAAQKTESETEKDVVIESKPEAPTPPKPRTELRETDVTSELSDDDWTIILTECKKNYSTLYGMLRMATPQFKDNTLTLTFKFAFHQKRMNEKDNQYKLNEILKRTRGTTVKIKAVVGEHKSSPKSSVSSTETISEGEAAESGEALHNISNIFGSAELLD